MCKIFYHTTYPTSYRLMPYALSSRVAQSVGHLTRKSEVLGSIPGLATYFRFSFRFFKKGSCQLLAKVCARNIGNRFGCLSLPRKSVVRLTDRPDMTLDVYCGRKTTMQQQSHMPWSWWWLYYLCLSYKLLMKIVLFFSFSILLAVGFLFAL